MSKIKHFFKLIGEILALWLKAIRLTFELLFQKMIHFIRTTKLKRTMVVLKKRIELLPEATKNAILEMDNFARVYYNVLEEIKNPNAVLAVDFDGTLCEHKFPNIGEPNWELIHYIQWRQKHGAKAILWTCRTGGKLNEAVKWCEERGLYFDAINENVVDVVNAYGSECRKVYADEYYDDRAVHIFKFPYINIKK